MGFAYKDKLGTPTGVPSAKPKAGAVGKAALQVQAKGVHVVVPALPLTGCEERLATSAQPSDSSSFSDARGAVRFAAKKQRTRARASAAMPGARRKASPARSLNSVRWNATSRSSTGGDAW